MRFSLLTISLDAGRHIAENFDSVAAQTCRSFEHILWDGGSRDNTLEIASLYPHLKIVKGKDLGIADAMNQVAREASGDYLLFLHADDMLAHREVLASLNNFSHPWIYGRAGVIDDRGKLLSTTEHVPFNAKRLRKYNIITHPAALLSRELFFEVGEFRTDLRYTMDYDLWLRLSKKHFPLSIPDLIANFRQHSGSLSTREKRAVADEAYSVRSEYVQGLFERWRSYRAWRKRTRKE